MRLDVLAGVILFVTTLAGCTDSATDKTGGDPADPIDAIVNSLEGFVDPFIMGHDHADASLHELAFHARQLYHHALGGNLLKSSGAHVVDVRGDWLFVGAYGLVADVEGGVYIFNIANRSAPEYVSHFPLVGNVGGDRSLEATADANWVVLGTEAIDCANHANPFGPGLYLIDVRDKTSPMLADYIPDTGVHSVTVHQIQGKDYAVTLGGTDLSMGRNIWEIDAANGKLKAVGSVPISHDAAVWDDPLLGKPLLYVTGQSTLDVYDWSDPADPQKLGSWAPPDVDNHYVHAVAPTFIEGRRILAVESEDWQELASPLWVLDATDLEAIEHVSNWTNPANAPANGGGENGPSLAFSTHNPRFENGTLYMAHYHAGAWILDLRNMSKVRAPEIMAYFLPHEDNGGYHPQSSQSVLPLPANPICFGGFKIHELPNTMDVEVRDGVMYAADLHTGVYAVRYDATVVPTA